jgi:signal transduction histidine kinase
MRLRFKSILSRIIWLHLLAWAGVVIAVSYTAYFLLSATANVFEERLLRDHAAVVAQYLKLSDGNWSLQLPPDLQALYSRGYGGYALAIIDDGKRLVFSSLSDKQYLFTPNLLLRAPSFFQRRLGQSVFYGVNFPVHEGDRGALIQVAQDLENADVIVDDVVANFLGRIAWIAIPIFAFLLAIDIIIVRRALRPMTHASQLAQSIRPNNINLRLPTAGLPHEVLPLVEAINQALDRLEHGFRIQREFTADAAHELRTPLSVLRTQVDMLPEREVAGMLRPYIDAMSRLVGQLLELAELESFTIGVEEAADLTAVCSEAVSTMAPIALADKKAIELTGTHEPVWIRGNAEMLFRAIRNLVENAIRYTATGTSVVVEVSVAGVVGVMDRGPGIAAADRKLIFDRFWRRDRRSEGHAGLGLSIVQRAIQIHGGSIRVDERPGGGAIFFVSLTPKKAV